jgi:hypothetical protein
VLRLTTFDEAATCIILANLLDAIVQLDRLSHDSFLAVLVDVEHLVPRICVLLSLL